MSEVKSEVEFEFTPGSSSPTKGTLVARHGYQILCSDVLDLAANKPREKFIEDFVSKHQGVDAETMRQKLLDILDQQLSRAEDRSSSPESELDVSRIVRPERFITPAVSGLAVPTVAMDAGKPVGRWIWYMRWADGRRERKTLAEYIDLPSGSRLWVHPKPSAPSMNMRPGWSADSREVWLAGSEKIDPAAVLEQLLERILYFLELPRGSEAGTATTIALWLILSYGYQTWDAVPYLYFGGPAGSGKTRAFEILARLAFRPLVTSTLTGPTLFRTVHDRGGVVLLDEAERLKESTPDMTELRTSLLAGYKAGTVATRMERVEDSFRTEYFDIFGPKALACINNLPPALASRCIPIMMFRASPRSMKPRHRIDEEPHRWQRLRDNLHILALENGTMWLDLAKRSDVCPEMSGRHYELWQPLLALAAWIEEAGASRLLSLMQEHAIATNEATRGEQTPDTDETLLRVLAEKISQGETPTAKAVLNYVQKQELDLFKSWSPRGVASHLARYGLKTNKTKGQKVYCQVTLDDLRHIELNYGLDLGLPEEESGSSSRDTVTNVPYVPYVPQEGQLDVLGEGT